jgi:two-component system, cell cycle sensor histidine kinase and response regulator CckA
MNWTPDPLGCVLACVLESASADVLLLSSAALALALLLLLYGLIRRVSGGGAFDIRRHYNRISEASGEVFFELDVQSRHLTWTSDLGSRFLGYSIGELTFHESTLLSLVHRMDVEPLRRAWEQLVHNERLDLEVRLLKKDGQWCWVHIIGVPEVNRRGQVTRVLGVVRNTQELHETQEALAEARRLETVGTMAGGIAHEFNNHLTPVRGYIEMTLDQLDRGHPAIEGLQTALNRVEYCSDLVSQIQAYGRKSLLLPKPSELTRILPSVLRVALSVERDRATNVSLEEQWPPLLPTVWLDQAQFQQAITHLVRNSLQAMPKGGKLTIHAEEVYLDGRQCENRRGARPGDFVCVSVADTGVGISVEHRERVLDPFYTTHGRSEARGMGLKMVQGMVAQHGGWLELLSEAGKGTEVKLFFPVKKADEKTAAAAEADADGTMKVLPAALVGRMLVADDESFIRDIVRRVFSAEGWTVEEAADHSEVWSAVKDKTYDLLILDVTMPGPSVESTVAEVLRTLPRAKILMISGFARDTRVEQLLTMGNIEFLGKPFSPKEILSRVDRMMAEPG